MNNKLLEALQTKNTNEIEKAIDEIEKSIPQDRIGEEDRVLLDKAKTLGKKMTPKPRMFSITTQFLVFEVYWGSCTKTYGSSSSLYASSEDSITIASAMDLQISKSSDFVTRDIIRFTKFLQKTLSNLD